MSIAQYKAIHDNCEPRHGSICECVSTHATLADAHLRRDEGLIGGLSEDAIKVMQADSIRAAKDLAELKAQRKGLALQPDVFVPAKLIRRKSVTADSR